MRVLGVDPGASGALAVLDMKMSQPAVVELRDMPTLPVQRGERVIRVVNGALLAELLGLWAVDVAWLEQVASGPKDGAPQAFSFGRSVGVVEGVLAALRVPVNYFLPVQWRGRVGLRAGQLKDHSRLRATQLWPSRAAEFQRAKDDGRAEACLIALAGGRAF